MSDIKSMDATQQEIADEFALFGDWSERYQYLIDLGKALPKLADEEMCEANRLHGCQSLVWIIAEEGDNERLLFRANSDSSIVAGLIALALRVYSNRTAQEIVSAKPQFIADTGLSKHLSPTRSNGLAALLGFIQTVAKEKQT